MLLLLASGGPLAQCEILIHVTAKGILNCVFVLALQSMTVVEAEEKLLIILKQVMEEKLTSTNVEVRGNALM